ncbi:MFS transporter [Enterococcus rivorum]|uniref:MFS transporter n=1 Tax=Enterococcus rivorum TaxID=762845 RepID=UPI001471388F|nr:MFS transporter [Enterococcus rivorum]MBP2100485.1 fucose permease [Enterococcus rivorum]
MKKKMWLLFIIFISLGFPDGLLGSGWPEIRNTFHFETEVVGILTMGIFIFSFLSSLMYTRLIAKLGLEKILQGSTLVIILGLLLFSALRTPVGMISSIIFLGIGAGCIDVAINDYVSFYYNEKIMSWVHAFWGIGISFGSGVMSIVLFNGLGWFYSYYIIAFLELCILIILIFNRMEAAPQHSDKQEKSKVKLTKLHYLGPLYYFCYGIEYVVGLYFSTFLLVNYSLSSGEAAFQVSLYWTFLMVGRFFTGFLISYMSVKKIVSIHLLISFLGGLLLLSQQNNFILVASILMGYGFSALYPMMMRLPYDIYNNEVASKIVAYQVGFQYLGVIILPVVCGFIFNYTSLNLFPISILTAILIMALAFKRLYSFKDKNFNKGG